MSDGGQSSGTTADEGSNKSVWAGATRGMLYRLGMTERALRNSLRKQGFLYSVRVVGDVNSGRIQQQQPTVTTRLVAMIKSGIIGVAVFGTYDFIVHLDTKWWHQLSSNVLQSTSTLQETTPLVVCSGNMRLRASVQPDALHRAARVPVYIHFLAGATAGLVQSAVLDAWELGHYYYSHHKRDSIPRIHVNRDLVLRRALHHAIGYGTLFGVYETLRRIWMRKTLKFLYSGSSSVPVVLERLVQFRIVSRSTENPGRVTYDVTAIPIGISFLSGGLAGQAHYLMNHFLRQWRPHVGTIATTSPSPTKQYRSHKSMKAPSGRGFAGAFLPAALSFAMFQYGGELVERLMNEQQSKPSFTLYIF